MTLASSSICSLKSPAIIAPGGQNQPWRENRKSATARGNWWKSPAGNPTHTYGTLLRTLIHALRQLERWNRTDHSLVQLELVFIMRLMTAFISSIISRRERVGLGLEQLVRALASSCQRLMFGEPWRLRHKTSKKTLLQQELAAIQRECFISLWQLATAAGVLCYASEWACIRKWATTEVLLDREKYGRVKRTGQVRGRKDHQGATICLSSYLWHFCEVLCWYKITWMCSYWDFTGKTELADEIPNTSSGQIMGHFDLVTVMKIDRILGSVKATTVDPGPLPTLAVKIM